MVESAQPESVADESTEARPRRVVLPEWTAYTDRDRRWIDRSWLLGLRYLHDVDWESVVGDAEHVASLRWIDRCENVVVFGDTSSVAEDLAKAVTCEALRRRRTARCYPASLFASWLCEGERNGRMRQRLRRWAEFDLVALTDVPTRDDGDVPHIRDLLNLRRGRGATLLTVCHHGPAWEQLWKSLQGTVEAVEFFAPEDPVTRVVCPSRTVVPEFDDVGAYADDNRSESDAVDDSVGWR